MIAYIIIFTIALCLAAFNKKTSYKTNLIFITCLLAFFAGCRQVGIDPDSLSYKEAWESIRDGKNIAIDPSFILLSKLTPYFSILLLVYSLGGVLLKIGAAVKLSPFPFFSILVYFSHYFFLQEMTQIRAGIAAGLLLWVIYYIVNLVKFKAFVILLLAIFFHSSAIIGLIFFFIDYKKNNLTKYILCFGITLIFYYFNTSVLEILNLIKLGSISRKIELYSELVAIGQQSEIHTFNAALFIQLFVGLSSYLICRKKLGNKYTLLITKIYWLGLIFYILLAKIPVFAFRVSELFLIGEFILIPQIILLFQPKIISKTFVVGISGILFILYVVILQSVNPYQINL